MSCAAVSVCVRLCLCVLRPSCLFAWDISALFLGYSRFWGFLRWWNECLGAFKTFLRFREDFWRFQIDFLDDKNFFNNWKSFFYLQWILQLFKFLIFDKFRLIILSSKIFSFFLKNFMFTSHFFSISNRLKNIFPMFVLNFIFFSNIFQYSWILRSKLCSLLGDSILRQSTSNFAFEKEFHTVTWMKSYLRIITHE